MIKKLIFSPLLFMAFMSFSQTLSVGPRLGYASSGMSRQENGKKAVNSVLAGGVFNFSFNDLFSLQLEAYYLKKGGGYGYILGGVDYSDYFTFKAIEVPLLAKFTVGKTKAKMIFMGGPYVGYILGGNRIYSDGIISFNDELKNFNSYDIDGIKTNRLDIGFQLGAGMSVDLGKGKLLTELRYGVGFTEWFKFNTNQNYGMNNLNHRTFAITAGYILPIWTR